MDLAKLVHLGDLSLTLPVGAAMAAWLLAARAWRTALGWSVLFACALGLVGATKIAFIGWGAGLPALGFKAISGHATGVTAVFPALFYLFLYRHGAQARRAGALAGLGLGALVAILLVAGGDHTAAEALAGWAMGAAAALGAIRLAAGTPAPPVLPGVACALLAFTATAWMMKSAPVGYWMIKAALILSGTGRPHSLDSGC
jgi:hypothetical protein